MPLVRKDFADHVGTLTLDHDEKRNALSRELIAAILEAFEDFERRRARVVILRANPGARVFCAGHDVRELPNPGRDPLSYQDPLEQVIRAIRASPAPVIGMIEGGVWGGGCEVALCCDLLIGAPSATFAITPAKLGVPYNVSGVLRVMSAVGAMLAREMFFTARPLEAERALQVGILNHLVPADELEPYTRELAATIARNSPLAVATIKEQLRMLSNAAPLHPETFERLQGLRRKVYDSDDYREGIAAFLEKRAPHFQGE